MEAKKRSYNSNMMYETEGNAARKVMDYRSLGNTAPELEPEVREQRKQQEAREQQKKQAKSLKPNFCSNTSIISMILLVAAIVVTLYTCLGYLKVQADIVVVNKHIKTLEAELSDLEVRNASAYNAVVESVDFDEVYRVAVTELGMVFPNKSTVLKYDASAEGYVRQFADIPEVDKINILKGLLP